MRSLDSAPGAGAVSVLDSGAAVAIGEPVGGFPYPFPAFRFAPFHELESTSQNVARDKLGYLEVTWNVPGLASVERKGWDSLTTNEGDGARLLGFTEGTWDCFVNHYEDSTWDELEEKGVQEHYRGLGWSRAHWENTADDLPYTESRWWDMLTDNEKKAANGLCYFERNWDKMDMNPNDSFFPHPVPKFRYRPWEVLDRVTENVASGMLQYDQELWDNLGSSVPEKNTFLNLDPDERAGALELGFYTHTWDCFMNHYLSYYWSSFHEDLRVAVEALGWDEASWTGDGSAPESEGKSWGALTPEERAAATRLCYFRETWDDEPIPRWYDYDAGEATAIPGEGAVPKDIDLDIFRETGYAGKAPDSVGKAPVRVASEVTSGTGRRTRVGSGVLVSVLLAGAFLLG